MISVPGWAAGMEREFLRERTRVAIAKPKAQGKHVGRPLKWSEATRRRIIDLVRRGITLREACKLVGVGYWSALKYLSRSGVPQGAGRGAAEVLGRRARSTA